MTKGITTKIGSQTSLLPRSLWAIQIIEAKDLLSSAIAGVQRVAREQIVRTKTRPRDWGALRLATLA
jgi:hypothetical protein